MISLHIAHNRLFQPVDAQETGTGAAINSLSFTGLRKLVPLGRAAPRGGRKPKPLCFSFSLSRRDELWASRPLPPLLQTGPQLSGLTGDPSAQPHLLNAPRGDSSHPHPPLALRRVAEAALQRCAKQVQPDTPSPLGFVTSSTELSSS